MKCFWLDIDETFYYRAGDTGAYDLATAEPWVPNPHDFMRKVWKVWDIILNLLDRADSCRLTVNLENHVEVNLHKPVQIQLLRQSTVAFAAKQITKMFTLNTVY